RPRLWLLFGLIAGLGLLTKLTMLYFGLAVFVALLVTPARRQLLGPWPWFGGALALIFLLPYVVWEIMHGWPTLEFWTNYGAKIDPSSPVEFLVEQIVTMQPPTLLLWIAGLYYYLFARDGRPVRVLGWIYVILFALFLVQNARFYFLAPAYPMLFAAGAPVTERFLTQRNRSWIMPAYAVVLAVSGIVVAPLTVVPALPVDTLARITGAAGGDAGIQIETRKVAKLPQNFADRFGWKNMTATVAGVYDGLPEDKRDKACILTGNYGEAGAIDFFGPKRGLPGAISGHNSYYVWGPGDCTGEVVVSIGVPREVLKEEFGKIQQRATVKCEYCMPDENGLPVYLNQEPKMPLSEGWTMFKHFD
ncbi:MAG: glycosyltransferase family 39 protein, partial [Rubrobacter sp.]|nr:glycosyltransferase family 39 protein [Rubrobacter sp.]